MSTTSTSNTITTTAAPELLEGSEAGRRCVLDYLHKRQARKADDASTDAGDASTAAVVGSMTPAVLRAAALAHDGYETPALNDRLYLHYRGFRRLSRHLGAYSGLKALWLDSNGLVSLEVVEEDDKEEQQESEGNGEAAPTGGLRALSQLRCLYLQNNLLTRVGDGLLGLTALVTLDISHNRLTRLEGLSHLPGLRTLNAARNCLRDDGEEGGGEGAIGHLVACTALTNVDLSHNELGGFEAVVSQVLTRMPALLSLNLAGNPVVSTAQFRKRSVVALPRLRYLDRPIFELERLAAEAWAQGGPAAERAARDAYKRREQEAHAASLASYRAWARRARGEGGGGKQEEGGGDEEEEGAAGAAVVVGDGDGDGEEEERVSLPPLVGGDGEEGGDGGDEKEAAETEKDEEGEQGSAPSVLVGKKPAVLAAAAYAAAGGMEELD